MVTTLRRAKAELSRMVMLAGGGEEVLITVRGKPIAKLMGLPKPSTEQKRGKWLNRLRILREKTCTCILGKTSEQLIHEDREDRF